MCCRECTTCPLACLWLIFCVLSQLTNTILDIVQQAANYKQLRKGANEGERFYRVHSSLRVQVNI